MTIAPGEFVAVVNPSGSGKSTLLRLALGFEDPGAGRRTTTAKDLSELDVNAVRRQIGTVMQSSIPFLNTVRECICGPRQFTDDQLWRVLSECGLADDIRRLPDGVDTGGGDRSAISGRPTGSMGSGGRTPRRCR